MVAMHATLPRTAAIELLNQPLAGAVGHLQPLVADLDVQVLSRVPADLPDLGGLWGLPVSPRAPQGRLAAA